MDREAYPVPLSPMEDQHSAHRSAEWFIALANTLPQLAWIASADGWIYWYNQRWYDYTGTTPEEMQGWGWTAVHHPEHVERVVARIRHSWKMGEPWEDTLPLRGKDGHYRWFLSRALPIRGDKGTIVGWAGTNTDVTERLEAEQEHNRLLAREHAARQAAETARHHLAVQYEVARLLAQAETTELPGVLPILCRRLDWDWGALWRGDTGASVLRLVEVCQSPVGAFGAFEAVSRDLRIAPGHGLPGRAWLTSSPAWVTDVAWHLVPERAAAARKVGLQSGVALPVHVQSEVVGALEFLSRDMRPPDTGVLATLTAVGDQFGQFLDRRHKEEDRHRLLVAERAARAEAERAAERTARLQAVTAALSRALTPMDVAAVVTGEGTVALGATGGGVFLLDVHGNTLEAAHSVGYSQATIATFQRISLAAPMPVADVVRTGQPKFDVTRATLTEQYPHLAECLRADGFERHAFLPLSIDERSLGALWLSFSDPRVFEPEDQAYAITLAQQCAEALERARLLEAEQAATRLRDDFLDMMSHDLRTPIAGIKASVGSLLRRDVRWSEEDQRAFLLDADREVDRLSRLVANLLDLSRIEAGVLTPIKQWEDLEDLISRAIRHLDSLAPEHPFVRDGEDSSPIVRVDGTQIEQALTNLLENAAKYSPPDSPIIVSWHLTDSPDGTCTLRIAVRDDGPGIPAQDQGKIFDKFYRLSGSSGARGTGMGLAIVQGLVHGHGGHVEVESVLGQGSTFAIYLPVERRPDEAVPAWGE